MVSENCRTLSKAILEEPAPSTNERIQEIVGTLPEMMDLPTETPLRDSTDDNDCHRGRIRSRPSFPGLSESIFKQLSTDSSYAAIKICIGYPRLSCGTWGATPTIPEFLELLSNKAATVAVVLAIESATSCLSASYTL
jgi:hypothetical protein